MGDQAFLAVVPGRIRVHRAFARTRRAQQQRMEPTLFLSLASTRRRQGCKQREQTSRAEPRGRVHSGQDKRMRGQRERVELHATSCRSSHSTRRR